LLAYEIPSTYKIPSKQRLSEAMRSVLQNNVFPSAEDIKVMDRAFVTESAGHD